ncbi:hypothetical protein JX266_007306 [Neoarthrinium moseri]|nr:hypothetical protein JX266_007306 [Neoarthrinium moseri]
MATAPAVAAEDDGGLGGSGASNFGFEERPSFEEFWKRSKETHRARGNVTFLPSVGVGAGTSSSEDASAAATQEQKQADDAAARAKAHRRAQVRKAQLQHRQRKANYTKELEMDIARLREQIDQTETESRALRTENDAIRKRLSRKAVASGAVSLSAASSPRSASVKTAVEVPAVGNFDFDFDIDWNLDMTTSMLGVVDALPPTIDKEQNSVMWEPEYMVSMEMSDVLQTPAYKVSNATSQAAGAELPTTGSILGVESTPTTAATVTTQDAMRTLAGGLTQEQTALVINFILALEHICWSHFDHSYYTHESYDPEAAANGHTLMATSMALQHAPPTVFTRINETKAALKSHPHAQPHMHGIEWRAGGLTLDGLYGLAAALNPPDRELTPVQAWFEVVRLYGPDLALDPAVLAALTREFAGVVKCLHFGAVIEREAFDSVVARVVWGRLESLGALARPGAPLGGLGVSG